MHIRLAAVVVALVVTRADAQVSDVRVMSSGATSPAYLQLVAPFESATKLKAVTLALSNGVGAANIATRVRGGEAVDAGERGFEDGHDSPVRKGVVCQLVDQSATDGWGAGVSRLICCEEW